MLIAVDNQAQEKYLIAKTQKKARLHHEQAKQVQCA